MISNNYHDIEERKARDRFWFMLVASLLVLGYGVFLVLTGRPLTHFFYFFENVDWLPFVARNLHAEAHVTGAAARVSAWGIVIIGASGVIATILNRRNAAPIVVKSLVTVGVAIGLLLQILAYTALFERLS